MGFNNYYQQSNPWIEGDLAFVTALEYILEMAQVLIFTLKRTPPPRGNICSR